MFIETVIVCSGYSDFLDPTLLRHKWMFDVVVVTSEEDTDTKYLCEDLGVRYITTDLSKQEGEIFQLNAGVDAGLKTLSKKGWVLSLNADMWLPANVMSLIEDASLDDTKLYGIDRYRVRGRKAWEEFLRHEDSKLRTRAQKFNMEPRMYSEGPPSKGYLPLGYFQLWNPKASGVYNYLKGKRTIIGDDINFAEQWPSNKREVLQNVFGYHLEAEEWYNTIDWYERKSERF